MFQKLRKILELLKEINKELRDAIASYGELQSLINAGEGGLSPMEANQVLEDFSKVKDNLEELGKE